jgi:hypothetical protein
VVYITDKYAQNTGTTHYYAEIDKAGASSTVEVDEIGHGVYTDIVLDGSELPIGRLIADTSWTTYTSANFAVAKVVSVDATNNVVIVAIDTDNDEDYTDATQTFGLRPDCGLAVYEVTDEGDDADTLQVGGTFTAANFDDDTFEYAGTATLEKGDIVVVNNDALGSNYLDLIIIP